MKGKYERQCLIAITGREEFMGSGLAPDLDERCAIFKKVMTNIFLYTTSIKSYYGERKIKPSRILFLVNKLH